MRSNLTFAFTTGGSLATYARTAYQYAADIANIKNGTSAFTFKQLLTALTSN